MEGTLNLSFINKMNGVEVKNKLMDIIKEMVISDVEKGRDIPDSIAQQILGNYGSTVSVDLEDENDDIDSFVKNLQKWIESRQIDDSNLKKEDESTTELSFYDKYLEAETEYCETLMKLGSILVEAVKYKEVYSEYFKGECMARESKLGILSKKCQFMKLQFLTKLYKEENALKGHLTLREQLKEELHLIKRKYNFLMEYNKCMSEIKNNKTFCEFFKEYKELKRIEEITDIIGTI